MQETETSNGQTDQTGSDAELISQQTNSINIDAAKPELTRKQKIVKEIKSISLILILVFTFRSIFFEPFRIPSGSMIPTLMIGDFILVNKFSYGFKVPFSDLFSDPVYLFSKSNPVKGDVVVFKYPNDTSINYIKRVVGVPGDTIEIREKIVYINGEAVKSEDITAADEGRVILSDMDEKFKDYNIKLFKVITGEKQHIVQQDSDNYMRVDYEKRVIPEGKFFVMGDNRDFSYDSRFWGFVPHEYIKGRAILVWFSLIFPFSEEGFKFRPWRIGTMIR